MRVMRLNEQIELLEQMPEGTMEDCVRELTRALREEGRSKGVVWHKDNTEATKCTAGLAATWVKEWTREGWRGGQMVAVVRSGTQDRDVLLMELGARLAGTGYTVGGGRRRPRVVSGKGQPIEIGILGMRARAGATHGYTINAAFVAGTAEKTRHWDTIWRGIVGGMPHTTGTLWVVGSRPQAWGRIPGSHGVPRDGPFWGFAKGASESGRFRRRLSGM